VVRFLPFLISLVLSVYALFSCIQTRDEDVPYLPKLVWIILIVFVPFVGPITWLLASRSQGLRRERTVPRPKPTGRPVAPDDDPDFLASLNKYRDPRVDPLPADDAQPADEADDRPQDKPAEPPADEKPQPKPKPKSKDKPEEAEEAPTEPDDGKA
jgi:outer membrane biosynthesis protein TonB